jgi:hypothetical protein
MATTDRKSRPFIKFNSGSGIYLKDGATDFENLGEAISGKLQRKSATDEVTLMGGDKVKRRGARECVVTVVLAQSNKTILDRIDALIDKTIKLFIDNGIAGAKRQTYYFPECEIIDTFDIEMAGGKHQAVALEVLVYPQSAQISVTPSTGFPTECGNSSAVAVTGSNPFYAIAEADVA